MSKSTTPVSLAKWAAALDRLLAKLDRLACLQPDCVGCAACRLVELRPLLALVSVALRGEGDRLRDPLVFPSHSASLPNEEVAAFEDHWCLWGRRIGLDALRTLIVCLRVAERHADALVLNTPAGVIDDSPGSKQRTQFMDLHPLLGALQFNAEQFGERLTREMPQEERTKLNAILGTDDGEDEDEADERLSATAAG